MRAFFSLSRTPPANLPQSGREQDSIRQLADLARRTGGEIILLSRGSVQLGSGDKTRLPLTDGVRMFLEGVFEPEILRLTAPSGEAGDPELAIVLARPGGEPWTGTRICYPHRLYRCDPQLVPASVR